MNALEFMIRFERDCLSFYETLGNRAKERELKDLYLLLADAQRRHLARLERITGRGAKRQSEAMLPDRVEGVDFGMTRFIFSHDLAKAMLNDRDAFEHVVHAEEDVIRLFEGMIDSEPNQKSRRMFSRLAEDEKEFLAEIEEIYEFVEKPGCYLEWGEFSNLRPL